MKQKEDNIKLKLTLTKKQIYKITRIKRWEDASASTNIVLDPRNI